MTRERLPGPRSKNGRLKYEWINLELQDQRESFLLLRNKLFNGYTVPQKTEVIRYAIYISILALRKDERNGKSLQLQK